MRGLMYFKALARFPASPLTMHRLRGLLSSVAQRPPLCMARTNFAAAAAAAAAVAAAAATSSTVNEPRERLSFSLDGKVALVTGASRGIGFASRAGSQSRVRQSCWVAQMRRHFAHVMRCLKLQQRCSFVASTSQTSKNVRALCRWSHHSWPLTRYSCELCWHQPPRAAARISTEDFHLVLRTNLTGPFVLPGVPKGARA